MTNNLIPGEYDRLLNLGPISPGWAQVTGRNSLRQLLFVHVNNYSPGYPRVFIAGTSEHNAVADALSSIAALWDLAVNNVTTTGHGSMQLQLDTVHSITEHYYQPYALASCEHDVILGQSDQRPVMFPVPPGVSPQMLDAGEVNNSTLSLAQDSTPTGYAFEFSGLSRSQILETPGLSSKDRLRWVELPQNPFNGTAIGAIVLLARDPSNATQELLMCNVAAGWGVSTLNVSSNLGTTALVQSQVDIKNLYNASMGWSLKNPNTEISSPLEETAVIRTYGFFDLPMFPQLPIAVTEDWARYLNPSVSNTNTTVFETLMASNLGPLHMVQTVQTILVELIVNGLSRFVLPCLVLDTLRLHFELTCIADLESILKATSVSQQITLQDKDVPCSTSANRNMHGSIGSESQLQGTLKTVVRPDNSSYIDGSYWFSGKGNIFKVDPVESQDWVKLHISSEFQGFAYNVNGATPKIAVAFLLAYCIFVLAHVLYVCIYGISSTCWDSIAEVTALAMNSTPTVALRNTCAGITELDIFKIPVRVLAARDEEGSDREHLELVFEYADGKTTELGHSTMKADRSYGTLPLMTKHVKTS